MLTDQLLPVLTPLIGFRENPTGDEVDVLPQDLLDTATGLTLDQCHELLQTATLRATYANTNGSFGEYLEQGRQDAIRSLLTALDTRLSEAGLSPRLLLPTPLLPIVRVAPLSIGLSGYRVGFRLTVLSDDIALSVDRIGLSVNGPVAVPLQFFEEELAPEFPTTDDLTGNPVTLTGNANGHWQTVSLPVLTPDKTYLLLYDPTLLGPYQAYNTFTRWPKPTGCGSCKGRCWAKYLRVEAVTVSALGVVNPVYYTNFGLNLVVSAVGDLSPRLLLDPKRLLPVLKQQLAMSFLEKIAYSRRKNGDTEDAIQGALFALTDKENANRVPILYDRAMSSLVKSMSAEASPVLDVDDSDDVTWTSI